MKPPLIKPPKLQPGDEVTAVSLSWSVAGKIPKHFQAGKHQLQEEFEFQVVELFPAIP